MTPGNSAKKVVGLTHGLAEVDGFRFWLGEGGELAPVLCFHLSVELAQGVELDLTQRRLDGFAILGCVIHEDAWHGNGEVGG
jgi:hypothetical protein